jgi:hypothetical protein
MTYEEFEWNILKLAYEDGLERFKPSYLAYALGLPHDTVSEYLEHATHAGLLEMDVTDDGRLEYFVPGVDKDSALPQPVWKEELDEIENAERPDEQSAQSDQSGQPAAPQTEKPQISYGHDGAVSDPGGPDSARDEHLPTDGLIRAEEHGGDLDKRQDLQRQDLPSKQDSQPSEPTDGSVDGVARNRALVRRTPPRRSQLPPALRAHIEERYGSEDGTVTGPGAVAVLDREATVNDADEVRVEGQLVKADDRQNLPLRIESGNDTFTDPSQTIFMRQLKVYGVQSESALREHVERLFTSFGYQAVHSGGERLRFERGSVTFILALVPLFVLVLPLFVYLFLYCMGRSTIQQEPVELDVQFRKLGDEAGTYEIDLTFIGMHGVVLGAADQRVLNQEVDTLRDELQWALSTG